MIQKLLTQGKQFFNPLKKPPTEKGIMMSSFLVMKLSNKFTRLLKLL